MFHPNTGEVRSDGIACWFIDTEYNKESFFVRHAYFLGANDPYKSLKTTLKAEINADVIQLAMIKSFNPFQVENARNYITHYLPAETVSRMDLDSLEVDIEGYVDDDLKHYFSDVV